MALGIGGFIEATLFVDGGYVRQHLRQKDIDERFDPTKLTRFIRNVPEIPGIILTRRVYFYDAVPDEADSDYQCQIDYLSRIERLPLAHVGRGFIVGKGNRRRQKAVDVQLAVDAMEEAATRSGQTIGLVAGDADFSPLAGSIRRLGPLVVVLAFANSLSSELRAAADVSIELPLTPMDWTLGT